MDGRTSVRDRVAESRGAAREEAIATATLELVAEVGYEALTMDAVAARARASKNTIYRRWSGKAELVMHAVRAHIAAQPFTHVPTGDLRGDLLALLHAIRACFSPPNRALIIGLLHAAERDHELAALLRGEILAQMAAMSELIARDTAAAGAGPADVEVLRELGPALIAARMVLLDQSVDDDYLIRLVDSALLPLLTRTAAPGGRR